MDGLRDEQSFRKRAQRVGRCLLILESYLFRYVPVFYRIELDVKSRVLGVLKRWNYVMRPLRPPVSSCLSIIYPGL